MFGRIVNKTQKSTTIFQNGKSYNLPFKSKHNIGDIIDSKDTLLADCKNHTLLDKFNKIYEYYNKKLNFLEKIKDFLKNKGYREVVTSKLKKEIVKERNINYIKTPYGYLSSSPEIEMKKLLCLGFDKLFELNPAYRNDPEDNLHSREFLILEWYESLAKPEEINQEFVELIKFLNGGSLLRYRDYTVNLGRVDYITYRELFKKHLSIDIEKADFEKLKREFNIYGSDDPSDIMDAIFSLHLQKHLGTNNPTIVYDFPSQRAALAKIENGWAKRYELYIATVELSNCYLEETDPENIKARFEEADSAFLRALELGMPPTSGIAVGIDRLFMLLNNLSSIKDIKW